jgi:hypothetical protein
VTQAAPQTGNKAVTARKITQLMAPFSTPDFTLVINRNSSAIKRHPKYARLLGIIAAEWNAIEQLYVLALAAALVVRSEVIFAMLGKVHGNRDKLQAVHAGLSLLIRSPTRRKELKRIHGRLAEVLQRRNHFVHGLYAYNGQGIMRLTIGEVVGPKPRYRPLPLSEVKALVAKMVRLKKDLYDFVVAEPWKAGARSAKKPAR